MKPIYQLIIFLLLCSTAANAQRWDWVNNQQVQVNGMHTHLIASDGVQKLYAFGHYFDTLTLGGTLLQGIGYNNLYLSRYDTTGKVIWAKDISITQTSIHPCDVIVSPGGKIIVSAIYKQPADTRWMHYLAQYDDNGTRLWERKDYLGLEPPGGGYPAFYRLAADAQGNIYLSGWAYVDFSIGGDTFTKELNMHVLKFNTNGQYIWGRQYGSPKFAGSEYINNIVVDKWNNVIITGVTHGNDTLVFDTTTVIIPTLQHTPTGSTHTSMFIAKINLSGATLWAKAVAPLEYNSTGLGLSTDSKEDIYVIGEYDDTVYFDNLRVIDTNIYPYGAVYMAKYSAMGQILWVRDLYTRKGSAGSTPSSSVDIKINKHDEIFVCDNRTSNGTITNISQFTLSQYDIAGNERWRKIVQADGPNASTSSEGICTDGDHNLYTIISLGISPYYNDSLVMGKKVLNHTSGALQFVIAKLVPGNEDVNYIMPVANQKNLSIYPNPFSGASTLSFEYKHGHQYTIMVTDVTGRVLRRIDNPSSGTVTLKSKDMSPGIYIVQLYDTGLLQATGKVEVY
jgi:hypothetical protein